MEAADLNNANPRPLVGGIPIAELAKEVLTWPLYTPFYVASGQVGYTVAGVAGIGAAYYLFGNPMDLDYASMAQQYFTAGVIQTVIGYAVSRDLQGLM